MPVNLQQLQSLLGVSSLSEVKINDSGELEKRSGIRAFFARIRDFFQDAAPAGGRPWHRAMTPSSTPCARPSTQPVPTPSLRHSR